MPDNKDFFRGLAIIALIAALPWLSGVWPGGSLFGMPFAAFLPLLAVPVGLIALVRAARDEEDGS